VAPNLTWSTSRQRFRRGPIRESPNELGKVHLSMTIGMKMKLRYGLMLTDGNDSGGLAKCVESVTFHLSLSRLSHRLPRGQTRPEVMQGTADLHHEIADGPPSTAESVFDDPTALDAAVDLLDPQPTLVQRLIGPIAPPTRAPGHEASSSA